MKHAAAVFAFVGLSLGASVASAQQVSTGYESFDLGARGFIRVDAPPAAAGGPPPSRILFVNNCKPSGCAVTPGNFSQNDNSITNVSSIVRGSTTRTLQPYSGSQATWDQIMACVRENYAPFNITVTDVDPGAVPHFEAMAGGRPGDLGFPSGVAGVASFACGIIPNAISFSFLNLQPNDVLDACWTISQESAHNFGLSHEMLGADAMTYNPNPPRKRFVDQTACIGTQGCCQPSQECQCGATEQNSYQELMQIFGPSGPDTVAPVVTITSPANGSAQEAGFPVQSTVTDNVAVTSGELVIDGAVVQTRTSGPWVWNAPATIGSGAHTVVVRASDAAGNTGSAQINITIGDPCTDDASCAPVGEGFVCVDGRCVPGAGTPGGLGEPCDSPEQCASGVCATKGGENRCTEQCDINNADSCASGFDCLSAGDGSGLCWPGDGATCGCQSDGAGGPALPIGAGIVLSALVLRRRRRGAASV